MKRAGLIFLVIVPLLPCGCVVSVTPDTSQTVVLDPGDTQDFAIRTSGIGGYDRSFYLVDVSNPDVPLSATAEQNNFSSVIDDGPQVNLDTATYTPHEESAGRYTILYAVEFGSPSTELEMVMQKIMKATYCKLWQVVVRGVAITPRRNVAVAPGTSITYTAAAYPEGDYRYEWLLDGKAVGIGAVYGLNPAPERCGTHRLSVTATGEGAVYTLSREIMVPLAKVGGSNSDRAYCIQPTPDGGFIVVGSWVLKLDAAGQILWQKKEYAGRSICLDADGGFIISGKRNDAPGIFKLDSSGVERWYQPFDVRWEFPQGDLIASGNGSCTAVMNRDNITTRTYENLLAKVTGNGASASSDWTRVFTRSGHSGSREYSTLLPTPTGGYWIVGNTGADRICVMRLDAGGNALSASPRLIGGGLERHCVLDAAIAVDGAYLLVDNLTFFWLPETQDISVLKLDESAN